MPQPLPQSDDYLVQRLSVLLWIIIAFMGVLLCASYIAAGLSVDPWRAGPNPIILAGFTMTGWLRSGRQAWIWFGARTILQMYVCRSVEGQSYLIDDFTLHW